MKKILFIPAVLLSVSAAIAQNPYLDYQYAFKVYNLTRFEEHYEIRELRPPGRVFLLERKDEFKILHPTFAFQWKTKKGNNFQELELMDLKWQNERFVVEQHDSSSFQGTVYAQDMTETAFALRYEYTLRLFRKKEWRLVPSVGFAASPYYNSVAVRPKVSSGFPTSELHTGIRTYVTPRLSWYFGKRMFLDLNVPVCIGAAEYTRNETRDPSVPAVEQEVSVIDFSTLPKMLSARIGIGIKF